MFLNQGKKETTRTILIFAYYSFNDPVFQSAVLPYFKSFPNSENWKFLLLTWEQKQYALSKYQKDSLKEELRRQNIEWKTLLWHSGSLKIIKKLYDLVVGMMVSCYLVAKYKADVIYSEGFPGAVISHYLSKVTGARHIVHTFEPHADYMLEAGIWSHRSWEFRLLKKWERKVARNCASILTATSAYKEIISSWGVDQDKIVRVPSCVDVDHFYFREKERTKIRNEYKIADAEVVIVYLGKIGGMYMDNELFDFFELCEKSETLKFKYFIFTGDDHHYVKGQLFERDIPLEKCLVRKLKRSDVPSYLSAADVAFCGIRPIKSRLYSSPIKNGEYWACGLPIIIPRGISDDYILAEKHKIGTVLNRVDEKNFEHVISLLPELLQDRIRIRQRAVAFCKEDRAIESYQKLIEKILLGSKTE